MFFPHRSVRSTLFWVRKIFQPKQYAPEKSMVCLCTLKQIIDAGMLGILFESYNGSTQPTKFCKHFSACFLGQPHVSHVFWSWVKFVLVWEILKIKKYFVLGSPTRNIENVTKAEKITRNFSNFFGVFHSAWRCNTDSLRFVLSLVSAKIYWVPHWLAGRVQSNSKSTLGTSCNCVGSCRGGCFNLWKPMTRQLSLLNHAIAYRKQKRRVSSPSGWECRKIRRH